MASTLIDLVDKMPPLGGWIPVAKSWLYELKNDAENDNQQRRGSTFSEPSDCGDFEEATTHRLGANPFPAPLRCAPPPPYEAQDAFYPQERRLPSRVYQHPSVSTESFSASSTTSASSTSSNYDDQDTSAAPIVTPRRPSGLNPSPSSSTSSKSSSRISYFRWSSSAPSTAPSSPTTSVMPVAEPVMIESPPRRSGKDRTRTDSSTSSTVSTTSPITGTIRRRNIEQAVTLASVAAEEDENGRHQVALDLYLTGLEKMLNALPVDDDPNVRRALQAKLAQFVDRNGLDLKEGTRDGLFGNFEMKAGSISEMMINAAVMSAIALKQSPIPDAISATLCYTFQTLQRVDAAYNVRARAWELTALGVTRALELDAEYNLHGRVSDAIYTSCAAFIKAGVAYTDAPGYKEVIAGRVNGEEKTRLMNGKGRAANLRQDQYRRASVL